MRPAPRWLKWLIAAPLIALLLLQLWFGGWLLWWKWVDPGTTRFMRLRLAELRERDAGAQLAQQWIAYERISPHLKRAVVAAEDDRFVDHEGFDWQSMQKALEKNQQRGRQVAGGSTITQQLAKNLFLTPARTPWRKAQEAAITLMIEALWDKRRTLEVYLNVVEWGEGIFGAEAAARHYYRSGADRLSAEQAARLAVMLPAPRRYGRNPYSAWMNQRTQAILGRMQHTAIP